MNNCSFLIFLPFFWYSKKRQACLKFFCSARKIVPQIYKFEKFLSINCRSATSRSTNVTCLFVGHHYHKLLFCLLWLSLIMGQTKNISKVKWNILLHEYCFFSGHWLSLILLLLTLTLTPMFWLNVWKKLSDRFIYTFTAYCYLRNCILFSNLRLGFS